MQFAETSTRMLGPWKIQHSVASVVCLKPGEIVVALLAKQAGVFVGISMLDFDAVLHTSPLGTTVYAATGSSHAIASGRLAYALGTHGPCLSIDTACSARCHPAV